MNDHELMKEAREAIRRYVLDSGLNGKSVCVGLEELRELIDHLEIDAGGLRSHPVVAARN